MRLSAVVQGMVVSTGDDGAVVQVPHGPCDIEAGFGQVAIHWQQAGTTMTGALSLDQLELHLHTGAIRVLPVLRD